MVKEKHSRRYRTPGIRRAQILCIRPAQTPPYSPIQSHIASLSLAFLNYSHIPLFIPAFCYFLFTPTLLHIFSDALALPFSYFNSFLYP